MLKRVVLRNIIIFFLNEYFSIFLFLFQDSSDVHWSTAHKHSINTGSHDERPNTLVQTIGPLTETQYWIAPLALWGKTSLATSLTWPLCWSVCDVHFYVGSLINRD